MSVPPSITISGGTMGVVEWGARTTTISGGSNISTGHHVNIGYNKKEKQEDDQSTSSVDEHDIMRTTSLGRKTNPSVALSKNTKPNNSTPSSSTQSHMHQWLNRNEPVQCPSKEMEYDNDPDLLAAIKASLEDQKIIDASGIENQSASDLLKSFQSNIIGSPDSEDKINVLISRRSIYKSTLTAIQRKSFSFFKPLTVTFTGEEAVDTGGPKREFFRLLMNSIKNSAILQGSWFSHDLESLSSERYKLAGQLVAWSVLHGGPGIQCLSMEGYRLFKGSQVDNALAVNAVGDPAMKIILQAIEASTSDIEFEENVIKAHGDSIAQYGFPKIFHAKLADKKEITTALLKQHYVFGVNEEIRQFIDGLDTVGKLGDIVMNNEAVFELILGNKQQKLTAQKFKSLYRINFVDQGSNGRDKGESTIYCFELFLKDLEEGEIDGLSLEDLLVFVSGADTVPSLGFDRPIAIEFYDIVNNERRLPWSSTCAIDLHIPKGYDDPEKFRDLMTQSLLEYRGFGKV